MKDKIEPNDWDCSRARRACVTTLKGSVYESLRTNLVGKNCKAHVLYRLAAAHFKLFLEILSCWFTSS